MRAHFARFQVQFDLDEYVAYMRRPGSSEDHLTLQATAFYLRRRVMIVSDHFFDQCSVTVVEPHLLVARGVWPIIVTAVGPAVVDVDDW